MRRGDDLEAGDVRVERPGARWLRCDLHVHTPFDGEKKFGVDVKGALAAFKRERPARLAEIAERFVHACRDAAGGEGVDLVAITDHNSIDGYRALRPQFEGIARQAQEQGLPMPAILPGVELTVGGERPIHFLVIFASDTPEDQIEHAIRFVFGEREPFDPKTGSPRSTGDSIGKFLEQLHRYCNPPTGERCLSCLILPAHAEGNSGVARETGAGELSVATSLWDEMRGHLRQWAISRTDWNGFETSRPFERLPQAFRDLLLRWVAARRGEDWDLLPEERRARHRQQRHWPLVECSDPHRYEAIGSRYTWLKMEVPDVEGIRLALLDPESRLRRMSEGRPVASYPHLRRVRVRRTDFFEDLTVPLHPSMTTLIGGRGSGKSTLVEYLRYGLDRARPQEFEGDEKSEIYRGVSSLLAPKGERDFGESPGTLLPDHSIEIDLEVAGRPYRVLRRTGGLEVIPDPGAAGAQPAMLDVRTLVVPRILSQRQISRIAKDPVAQRRELDALLPTEWVRSWEDRRQALLDELASLQVQRTRFEERFRALPARETELRTLQDQIAFLEGGGRREVFSRFEARRKEAHWLDDARRELGLAAEGLEQQAGALDGALRRIAPPAESGPWTAEVSQRLGRALTQAVSALREQAGALRGLSEALVRDQESVWRPEYEKVRAEYDALMAEMRDRGVETAQHQKLLQQRALLQREVEELRALREERERSGEMLRAARQRLVLLHEERLGRRRHGTQVLEKADADVRLEIDGFRDREDLESRREEWTGGSKLQARDWEGLMEYVFSPDGSIADRWWNLVGALRADVAHTQALGRPLEPAGSAVAELLGAESRQLTRHFWNALQRGDRFRLDEMERFLPEDEVRARVRGADGLFKPISQGSVGQRSTAILSLLLSAGEQPLIIDQPEDDLDNQYIYDVVVDLLRKRKFSRQIVIATHNANIPVNGDAELIVAMGVEDRLGMVAEIGSIDRPEVKTKVSQIMEGSAEAFRLRKERYGF